MVDPLDLGHFTEFDHERDFRPLARSYQMERETFHETEISADSTCPFGYKRVGCCKCIRDLHPGDHHLTEEISAEYEETPRIHGVANEPLKD